MADDYPEAGEIERDVIAEDAGPIEADVIAANRSEPEEEEYEVEAIVGHKTERGKWKYLVSWKGYGSEHNTWEPEANLSNLLLCTPLSALQWNETISWATAWPTRDPLSTYSEHAQDMIDAYIATQPKQAPKRGRPSSGTPSKPPAKRGRQSKASQAKAAVDDDELTFSDTHIDLADKFMEIPDWEPLVKQVDSMERGSNSQLAVYLTMKSGERFAQSTEVVYKRCPQAMLRFYESFLKWRNDGV